MEAFGVEIESLPQLSQREQHRADFFRKRGANKFLELATEGWGSIKFRGVELADFDREHLEMLCVWLGKQVMADRNERMGVHDL